MGSDAARLIDIVLSISIHDIVMLGEAPIRYSWTLRPCELLAALECLRPPEVAFRASLKAPPSLITLDGMRMGAATIIL